MNFSLDLPYAFGAPQQQALFKSRPEDFIVEELFDLQATGTGEHLFLHLRKTGENTQFVADALADYFGIKKMDVGVAGMKDRNAITTQWFSCYLPGSTLEFDVQKFVQATSLNVELLQQVRHSQKLRRGAHQGNRFEIVLRDLQQNPETETRLQRIQSEGVPNYFGEQRFGHEGSNLKQFNDKVEREANRDSRSRNKRHHNKNAMLVSAARSYLFNLVLAERVKQNTWQQILDGEALLNEQASGPLWGRGRNMAQGHALEIEKYALAEMQTWCNSLEHAGLQQERRALKLSPQNFQWQWKEFGLELRFQLNPGEYATSVLREICSTSQGEAR